MATSTTRIAVAELRLNLKRRAPGPGTQASPRGPQGARRENHSPVAISSHSTRQRGLRLYIIDPRVGVPCAPPFSAPWGGPDRRRGPGGHRRTTGPQGGERRSAGRDPHALWGPAAACPVVPNLSPQGGRGTPGDTPARQLARTRGWPGSPLGPNSEPGPPLASGWTERGAPAGPETLPAHARASGWARPIHTRPHTHTHFFESVRTSRAKGCAQSRRRGGDRRFS